MDAASAGGDETTISGSERTRREGRVSSWSLPSSSASRERFERLGEAGADDDDGISELVVAAAAAVVNVDGPAPGEDVWISLSSILMSLPSLSSSLSSLSSTFSPRRLASSFLCAFALSIFAFLSRINFFCSKSGVNRTWGCRFS